jgi:TraX protein
MPHRSTIHRPFNTWDAMKLLGLLLMLVDHTGHFFFPHAMWLRAIGRGAAPIFMFLAGFASDYRLRWELVFLAVPLDLYNWFVAGHFQPMNILFTVICCRLILEKRQEPANRIRKPLEWYLICVAWILSVFLIQYGTLAMLFALCGYMKRFAADYTLKQRRIFWLLAFVTYAVFQSTYSFFSGTLGVVTISCVGLLLWRMEIRPIDLKSHALVTAGKWTARHMAYIYAGHLAILMWFTGKAL